MIGPDGRHWPRGTAADPTLPHQIDLRYDGSGRRLYVTCNCQSHGQVLGWIDEEYGPLEQAWDLYRAHLPAGDS